MKPVAAARVTIYQIQYDSEGKVCSANQFLQRDFFNDQSIVGTNIDDLFILTEAKQNWLFSDDEFKENSEAIIKCKVEYYKTILEFHIMKIKTLQGTYLYNGACSQSFNYPKQLNGQEESTQDIIDRRYKAETVLDNIPSYIILFNEKFGIENINKAGENASQYTLEQIKTSRGFDLFNCVNSKNASNGCGSSKLCNQCGINKQLQDSLNKQRKIINKTVKLRCIDSEGILSVYLNLTTIPITLNKRQKILAIADNITDRISMEQTLIAARVKAEEGDKQKATFLATMSHELRTPLNSVIGFSELIGETESLEEIKEMAAVINTNGSQLANIVNDILEISSLQDKELTINKEYFKISALYHELKAITISELETNDKSNIELKISRDKDIDMLLYSDYQKIKTVFIQLIRNSVKFTNQGNIEFGHYIDEAGRIVFFIKDSGIGINMSRNNNLFHEFTQIEDYMTRAHGGIGIGLSIAQRLVQGLGGKIWFTSKLKKGSAFYFKLNCLVNNEKENKNEHNSLPNFGGQKILIAEDNDSNYNFLRIVLSRANLNFIRAFNGQEAVDLIEENKDISLVLMDIEMPVMNGIDATKIIKKTNPEITIIAQTAYAMPSHINKYKEAGCNDFIAKPYSVSKILNLLQTHFKVNGVTHEHKSA